MKNKNNSNSKKLKTQKEVVSEMVADSPTNSDPICQTEAGEDCCKWKTASKVVGDLASGAAIILTIFTILYFSITAGASAASWCVDKYKHRASAVEIKESPVVCQNCNKTKAITDIHMVAVGLNEEHRFLAAICNECYTNATMGEREIMCAKVMIKYNWDSKDFYKIMDVVSWGK